MWKWTTVRHASAEFGKPFAARYAAELADLTDAELIALDVETVVQYAKASRAATRQRLPKPQLSSTTHAIDTGLRTG